ncbi:MAG: hypothetical protein IJ429_00085 [Lachnospiraceae bacterium]|nr:hypothetical protein [Lachnospiraceae bacterium]
MNNCNFGMQLATFTKLQLVNLYGKNVYRNLKDPKEKRKKFWLYIAYAFVIVVVAGYAGALSYAYVQIGLAEILPAYLIMAVSLIILLFSIFKAGDIVFQKNSYDILISLPVKNSTIVISRFIRLYVENILLAAAVMSPAMIVFGVMEKPSLLFYVTGMIVMLFIPLLPITISVFVGALIMAISSRSKHKNLVSVLLSVALVIGFMVGSMKLSVSAENIDIDELKNLLNMILDVIKRFYPPAVRLGDAMLTGNLAVCLGCVCAGFFAVLIVIVVISMHYTWICDGFFSTSAKHDYKMESLRSSHMLSALYKREFKRYFASSVYVTNTIISPIMGMLFAVAMLFSTEGQLDAAAAEFYAQSGLILQMRSMLPMTLATVFCIMPITAVSISMEGRQWWIIKTLPISAKQLLDSKLLMNLSILAPCCGISVIMVAIGQKVTPVEFVWLVLVPFLSMLFSCVFGQTVNLKLPVFDWENEVSVVKQSASMFVGGLVPFLVMIVLTFGVMLIPAQYTNLTMTLLCLLLGITTFMLYRRNSRVDLLRI